MLEVTTSVDIARAAIWAPRSHALLRPLMSEMERGWLR